MDFLIEIKTTFLFLQYKYATRARTRAFQNLSITTLSNQNWIWEPAAFVPGYKFWWNNDQVHVQLYTMCQIVHNVYQQQNVCV